MRYFVDYFGCGHTRFRATNRPRSNATRFIVTAEYFAHTTIWHLQNAWYVTWTGSAVCQFNDTLARWIRQWTTTDKYATQLIDATVTCVDKILKQNFIFFNWLRHDIGWKSFQFIHSSKFHSSSIWFLGRRRNIVSSFIYLTNHCRNERRNDRCEQTKKLQTTSSLWNDRERRIPADQLQNCQSNTKLNRRKVLDFTTYPTLEQLDTQNKIFRIAWIVSNISHSFNFFSISTKCFFGFK